jgi:hypothetical protein
MTKVIISTWKPWSNTAISLQERVDQVKVGWRPTCNHYPYAERWRELPPQREMDDKQYYWSTLNIRLEQRILIAFWEKFDSAPAIVFDPFVGTGTTLEVARQLGRSGVGVDLSNEYLHLARQRLLLDQLDAWENGIQDDGKDFEGLPMFERLGDES